MIVFAYCLNDIFFHNFNAFRKYYSRAFYTKQGGYTFAKANFSLFFLFMFNNITLNTIALQ